jgi:hypothetical protein
MLRCSRIVLPAFVILLFIAPVVHADPIAMPLDPELMLTASGGDVDIFFAGSDAGYNSQLFLSSPSTDGPFFPNHSTPIGESAALGMFSAGTELIFRLNVLTSGNNFFTGPGSRNPDNMVHAIFTPWAATAKIPAGILVAFEDLRGGGDHDFNDFRFVVSGGQLTSSSTPEPTAILLLGTGALGLLARARSRGSQSQTV